MSNVFAAIQNRDAGALARMMGPDNHQAQQDNVVNISAERLVDALFKQLKQLFPAAEQTNLKTAQQETDAKRQWNRRFRRRWYPYPRAGISRNAPCPCQ